MEKFFTKRLLAQFTKNQLYLILADFLLVLFLIVLFNLGILPFGNIGDFLFFAFLFLFFALYRPGWAFLFFAGTIVLENVNLAPENLGIAVRPYQFLGALIIAALLVRFIFKRLNFELLKLKWYDYALLTAAIAGFLPVIFRNADLRSLQLAVVFSSFVILYFLIRNYIREISDLKKIIPFFLVSSAIVVIYGIWQNVRFMEGLSSFETMPGRPNATFPEADWLGIYLVLLIAATYAIIFYFDEKAVEKQESPILNFKFSIFNKISNLKSQISNSRKLLVASYWLLITLTFILLILTVSRSAWLGAAAATFIFLLLVLTESKINPKNWQWRKFFEMLAGVLALVLISASVIYFFNLTSFQLFNRTQSIGSGLQKITISCGENAQARSLPHEINDISELERFGCRHINLEEIEKERSEGRIIAEIYRGDPSAGIRSEIYAKSWEQIKRNPILGIGWGSIGNILGADSRGAALNASNIFLEIWLGSGLIGFLAFLAVWVHILIRAGLKYARAADVREKIFSAFVISAWAGLTVSNSFNSGIFLGFLWFFMAIAFIDLKSKKLDNS